VISCSATAISRVEAGHFYPRHAVLEPLFAVPAPAVLMRFFVRAVTHSLRTTRIIRVVQIVRSETLSVEERESLDNVRIYTDLGYRFHQLRVSNQGNPILRRSFMGALGKIWRLLLLLYSGTNWHQYWNLCVWTRGCCCYFIS
jgi:hypothetical protein